MFCDQSSPFCKSGSLFVLQPVECPDHVSLAVDVPGVVRAHALRLVAEQVRDLGIVSAVALPPSRIGYAQAVQRRSRADQTLSLPIAQPVAHARLHLLFALPWRP